MHAAGCPEFVYACTPACSLNGMHATGLDIARLVSQQAACVYVCAREWRSVKDLAAPAVGGCTNVHRRGMMSRLTAGGGSVWTCWYLGAVGGSEWLCVIVACPGISKAGAGAVPLVTLVTRGVAGAPPGLREVFGSAGAWC
jgi:hypothetical protein